MAGAPPFDASLEGRVELDNGGLGKGLFHVALEEIVLAQEEQQLIYEITVGEDGAHMISEDNGTKSIENKCGYFEKHTEKKQLFISRSRKAKVNAHRSYENGKKPGRRIWSESNQEFVGKKTAQTQHGLSKPAHSNPYPGVPKLSVINYAEGGHNLRYIKQLALSNRAHYECPECKKLFALKANLTRHLRIHTRPRPHKCTDCEKSFSIKKSLMHHLRTHSGERPFQCPECEKRFMTKGCLTVHLRTHSGKRPYHCTECKKTFIQKGHLSRHQSVHLGQRPYVCSECGKSFAQKMQLISHDRVHNSQCDEPEKTYCEEQRTQCTECKKGLRQLSDHIRHHLKCKGEQLYKCSECENIFAQNTHHISQQRKHAGTRTGKTHMVIARQLEVSIPNEYFILRHGE
ncbi:zinc finger protein 182-like isoform X2 [Ambystoma mexicanum]|uniref:zinc finger protein 182-like isoform X2 n=2 Tax=Ambystoma mexicanum TaxID=8296 RepID=UPI0037E96E18